MLHACRYALCKFDRLYMNKCHILSWQKVEWIAFNVARRQDGAYRIAFCAESALNEDERKSALLHSRARARAALGQQAKCIKRSLLETRHARSSSRSERETRAAKERRRLSCGARHAAVFNVQYNPTILCE